MITIKPTNNRMSPNNNNTTGTTTTTTTNTHGTSSTNNINTGSSSSKSNSNKLTVVLDLDETLIHSFLLTEKIQQQQATSTNCPSPLSFDVILGPDVKIRVNKRPGLDQFLKWASQRFDLVCFTASRHDYANPILDVLDPDGTIFQRRLFRQHCSPSPLFPAAFTKDLSILGIPMERVVLVDNSLHCFSQISNGIPIIPFFNNVWDVALYELSLLLETCNLHMDVRGFLQRTFSLEQVFLHELSNFEANKHLYIESLRQELENDKTNTIIIIHHSDNNNCWSTQ
jgi:Dullard-like phosphatase family protein